MSREYADFGSGTFVFIHLFLRISSVLFSSFCLLGTASESWYRWVRNISPIGVETETFYLMGFSVLLPTVAIVELMIYSRPPDRRGAWIDFIFTSVWFLCFWVIALYGFTHYSVV